MRDDGRPAVTAFSNVRDAEGGHLVRRKRIGLFGNFGTGNLGNDGSLEAILLFLREAYPDAELVCICNAPEGVREQFGIEARPLYAPRLPTSGALSKLRNRIADHRGAIRNLRDIDVLIVPGTGCLDDFGERPVGMPYMTFLICLLAKLRGIKIIFVSIGAGPIRHPLSRWFMTKAASFAAYRSYRDEMSKKFLASVGIDVSKDPVYPDLAFRLPEPPPAERPTDAPLIVGLGLMKYNGWSSFEDIEIYNKYLANMTAFALWLLENGHDIRLFVGEATDGCAVDAVQDAVFKELGASANGRIIFEAPHSLHDLMSQLSGVDVMVTTRFHNVLCALKIGKPVISLGYALKNDVLMASMGLGREFCQHVERLDLDLLKRQLTQAVENRGTLSEIVRQNGAALRERLKEQERFLTQHLI